MLRSSGVTTAHWWRLIGFATGAPLASWELRTAFGAFIVAGLQQLRGKHVIRGNVV